MTGKTIRIFLADGEPTGILLAEISNWTGKVLVAPRSQLDQLSKREEVRRTGVYLLVGPDPDDPSRALAYIGEGDNVLKRLLRHNKNEAKDFWERTVVIVSKDENLTKSHVRYLESRLIKLAQDAHRAKLTNDTAPEPTKLPESDEADMEFFLAQVQMVLPVLGFDFTQPKPTSAAAKPAKRRLAGLRAEQGGIDGEGAGDRRPVRGLRGLDGAHDSGVPPGESYASAAGAARRRRLTRRERRSRLACRSARTSPSTARAPLPAVRDGATSRTAARTGRSRRPARPTREWQDAKLAASGATSPRPMVTMTRSDHASGGESASCSLREPAAPARLAPAVSRRPGRRRVGREPAAHWRIPVRLA